MAVHSVVYVKIIFNLYFSLSNRAKADNKCAISNDLVHINNAFVQAKVKIILKTNEVSKSVLLFWSRAFQ